MAFVDHLRVAIRITGSRYTNICNEAQITRPTLYGMLQNSKRPRKTTANLVLNAVVSEINGAEHQLNLKLDELRRTRMMLVKSYEEEYGSHE